MPRTIQKLTGFEQELDMLHFQMFMGFTNIEIKNSQDESMQYPYSPNKSGSVISHYPELPLGGNKLLESPDLKISAPRYICSLFADMTSDFFKLVE